MSAQATILYAFENYFFFKFPPHLSEAIELKDWMYRQISNIRCTQSQNINVCRLVLKVSLPNPLKPGVKLRMKM